MLQVTIGESVEVNPVYPKIVIAKISPIQSKTAERDSPSRGFTIKDGDWFSIIL